MHHVELGTIRVYSEHVNTTLSYKHLTVWNRATFWWKLVLGGFNPIPPPGLTLVLYERGISYHLHNLFIPLSFFFLFTAFLWSPILRYSLLRFYKWFSIIGLQRFYLVIKKWTNYRQIDNPLPDIERFVNLVSYFSKNESSIYEHLFIYLMSP